MAETETKTETERDTLKAEQLRGFLAAIKDAQSVELKFTVPETSHRSAVAALDLDPLYAQIRQVYFFDTPDLTLNSCNLFVRARRVQAKEHDTVVKLRGGNLDQIPGSLRKSPNLGIEVDAMPGGYVCSASMKGTLGTKDVKDVTSRGKKLHKLYSKEQRAFYEAFAPQGLAIDSLSILGPITVFKLKFSPKEFKRKLVVELWNYPDGSRILELSTKTTPDLAIQVALELRAFLSTLGMDLSGEQPTKTKTALEFFSRELRANETPNAASGTGAANPA